MPIPIPIPIPKELLRAEPLFEVKPAALRRTHNIAIGKVLLVDREDVAVLRLVAMDATGKLPFVLEKKRTLEEQLAARAATVAAALTRCDLLRNVIAPEATDIKATKLSCKQDKYLAPGKVDSVAVETADNALCARNMRNSERELLAFQIGGH
jgi:hypothetical protein